MQRFNFGFPKAQIKLDELMVEFLFELKDYDKDQEENAQVTCHGVISMMKAFCNVQQAILMSPSGIIDKDKFFDNKVEISAI